MLRIAACAEAEVKARDAEDFGEVLTKTAWEGGGRRHRLLAALDHGTYHRVVAGAVEGPRVSAHCCSEERQELWAVSGARYERRQASTART